MFSSRVALAQTPAVGATAEVRDASNRVVATAEFREGRGEVLITLLFPNPPILSGTHAVHINDVGRCEPPTYATAGNIFNPLNKKHGRQNPEGAEVGDLPNINLSTGLTSYNTTAPGATLGSGAASLLGPNRTSLVIFSGEDDQLTGPEGNAGSRIACGVITPASAGAAAPAAPVVGAQPTPTPVPVLNPAVPKIASPVPVQQQPQPVQQQQPQPAQPVAGQPAVKPASPVVVGPGVVVKPATTPSAVVAAPAAQAIPTPLVAAPTAAPLTAATSTQGSGGFGNAAALVIAVLGVGLLAAGYLLRRRSQLMR